MMDVLLDTHTMLWFLWDDSRLSCSSDDRKTAGG
jgi:PIN domain nuclease of toxin-antitoxin system